MKTEKIYYDEKRMYQSPDCEVFEIEIEQNILGGSVSGDGSLSDLDFEDEII